VARYEGAKWRQFRDKPGKNFYVGYDVSSLATSTPENEVQ